MVVMRCVAVSLICLPTPKLYWPAHTCLHCPPRPPRSFQGFTCLMQLSSRSADYVVDCLALRWAAWAGWVGGPGAL